IILDYRKTHQFGGVQPFYIWKLPRGEEHLCLYRAYAQWQAVLQGENPLHTGYLFRKIGSGDRVNYQKDEPIV
ncbi:hypothetical protein DFH07DRAFT_712755, partial [Mycena maculata]